MLKIFKSIFSKKYYKLYLGLGILIIFISFLLIIQNNIIEKFKMNIFKEVKDMTDTNQEGEYPMPECKKKHYTYFKYGTSYLKSQQQIETINNEIEKDENKNKTELYLVQIDAQNKNMEEINKKLNNMLKEDVEKDASERCFDIDEYYK